MATNSTSNQPVQPENEIDLIEGCKEIMGKAEIHSQGDCRLCMSRGIGRFVQC